MYCNQGHQQEGKGGGKWSIFKEGPQLHHKKDRNTLIEQSL